MFNTLLKDVVNIIKFVEHKKSCFFQTILKGKYEWLVWFNACFQIMLRLFCILASSFIDESFSTRLLSKMLWMVFCILNNRRWFIFTHGLVSECIIYLLSDKDYLFTLRQGLFQKRVIRTKFDIFVFIFNVVLCRSLCVLLFSFFTSLSVHRFPASDYRFCVLIFFSWAI